MGEETSVNSVTLELIKRDIGDVKAGMGEVTALVKSVVEKQQAQAVSCAATCATMRASIQDLNRRQDDQGQAIDENRKRLNGVFTANTVITAIGSLIAGLFGK